MENGLKILVSELQKQNQILQTAMLEAEEKAKLHEEKAILFEGKVKLAEESVQKTKEELKYLRFLYDQLKRLMFGARRERFIANSDVNQMTLPFDVPEQPIAEQPTETIEYTRKKTSSRENHHGRLELPSHLPVEEIHTGTGTGHLRA